MTAIISTPYSRDLGDELRRLRESCTSFNGRAMAVQLGWDPSKVSDIELGKARASEIDLVQYMATCGKNIEFFEEFRHRYYNAFDLYFAQVPDNVRTLAMTEAMATKIFSYDVLTLHGLMQTEGYARQLFVDSHVEAPDGHRDACPGAHGPANDHEAAQSAGMCVLRARAGLADAVG